MLTGNTTPEVSGGYGLTQIMLEFVNTSIQATSDSSLFHHCWRLQNCEACLRAPHPCAWCATSQTYVPNDNFSWPFGILSPIEKENICPLSWRERWEMRAKPFSCRCSTMTLISVVVAILCTLAGMLIIWLLSRAIRWAVGKWKKRQPGWWKLRWYCRRQSDVVAVHEDSTGEPERQPFLA